jgi:hypothetical protein
MSATPAAPASPETNPARPFRYGWVVLAIATVVAIRPRLAPERKAVAA